MPFNMNCEDCGGNGDATCHLLSFEDEPWLCRECTDKRVAKLVARIAELEKQLKGEKAWVDQTKAQQKSVR